MKEKNRSELVFKSILKSDQSNLKAIEYLGDMQDVINLGTMQWQYEN
jgi:hypothetical protein